MSTTLDYMSIADLAATTPEAAAAELAHTLRNDPAWLDAFSEAMRQERSANQARWVFESWGISQSEAGRLFGVSRQAVSRWLVDGIPATQLAAFADLAAATDILTHYVKRDRLPAVVRRPARAFEGQSLLDMLRDGRTPDIVIACRTMFQFADIHQ